MGGNISLGTLILLSCLDSILLLLHLLRVMNWMNTKIPKEKSSLLEVIASGDFGGQLWGLLHSRLVFGYGLNKGFLQAYKASSLQNIVFLISIIIKNWASAVWRCHFFFHCIALIWKNNKIWINVNISLNIYCTLNTSWLVFLTISIEESCITKNRIYPSGF